MPFPDHNLQGSWEIDFDRLGCTGEQVLQRLGYTRQEALDLVNLGYLRHAICLFIYMFFVVGGHFIVAIYRMGSGSSPGATDAAPAPVTAAEYAQPVAGASPLPR